MRSLELIYSPYCAHCRTVRNRVTAWLKTIPAGVIGYRELNVLDHLDFAVEHGVTGTPTLLFDGRVVARGDISSKQLAQLLHER